MPWCEKCKIEYKDGITVCNECGATLKSKLPNEGKMDFYAMEPVKLTSSTNQIEADLFCGILESEGIPFYTQHIGSGSYLNLYMGFSVYGVNIYVDQSRYDEALELLEIFLTEIEDNDAPPKEITNNNATNTNRNGKIVARIIILIMIASLILSLLIDKGFELGWFR